MYTILVVVEEDKNTLIIRNQGGQTVKVLKDHPQKMPMYLDQPVKDWETWKEYKKRLDPGTTKLRTCFIEVG